MSETSVEKIQKLIELMCQKRIDYIECDGIKISKSRHEVIQGELTNSKGEPIDEFTQQNHILFGKGR